MGGHLLARAEWEPRTAAAQWGCEWTPSHTRLPDLCPPHRVTQGRPRAGRAGVSWTLTWAAWPVVGAEGGEAAGKDTRRAQLKAWRGVGGQMSEAVRWTTPGGRRMA